MAKTIGEIMTTPTRKKSGAVLPKPKPESKTHEWLKVNRDGKFERRFKLKG